MNERENVGKALRRLSDRGMSTSRYYAYYEGRHDSNLGSAAWNTNFRRLLGGVIDNQCVLVIDSQVEDVQPEIVEATTEDPLDILLAEEVTAVFEKFAATLDEHRRHAKISGTQACVMVDVDDTGEVVLYTYHVSAMYVQTNRAGKAQWAVLVWRTDDEESYTQITYLDLNETVQFSTSSKNKLPTTSTALTEVDRKANPFGRIMVSIVDERDAVLQRIIPLNDALNKNIQLQTMQGEGFAMPLRLYLGIETYNAETGEVAAVIPDMSPSTGSRDVSIPTVQDAEGGERKVIQLDSQSPAAFEPQNDSLRVAISRQGNRPAFLLQQGGSVPASGEALQIATIPQSSKKRGDEKAHYGPHYRELAGMVAQVITYQRTGVVIDPPKFKINFVMLATWTESDRVGAFEKARSAGMSMADALVRFLAVARDEAELAEAEMLERQDATAQAFNAGF